MGHTAGKLSVLGERSTENISQEAKQAAEKGFSGSAKLAEAKA
jgi:hypothetical protein